VENENILKYSASRWCTTLAFGTMIGHLKISFGSNGSANGQFASPHSVAVSPNGSIYMYFSDTYKKNDSGVHQLLII